MPSINSCSTFIRQSWLCRFAKWLSMPPILLPPTIAIISSFPPSIGRSLSFHALSRHHLCHMMIPVDRGQVGKLPLLPLFLSSISAQQHQAHPRGIFGTQIIHCKNEVVGTIDLVLTYLERHTNAAGGLLSFSLLACFMCAHCVCLSLCIIWYLHTLPYTGLNSSHLPIPKLLNILVNLINPEDSRQWLPYWLLSVSNIIMLLEYGFVPCHPRLNYLNLSNRPRLCLRLSNCFIVTKKWGRRSHNV